jgi:hypothetical protein
MEDEGNHNIKTMIPDGDLQANIEHSQANYMVHSFTYLNRSYLIQTWAPQSERVSQVHLLATASCIQAGTQGLSDA